MFNAELAKTRTGDLGMTQTELAEKAGVSRAYLSCVLNGHYTPSYKLARKIAKALSLPVGQLWIIEDDYEPYLNKTYDEYYESLKLETKPIDAEDLKGIIGQTPLITFDDGGSTLTLDMGVRLSNKECEVLLELLSISRINKWTDYMEDDERFDKFYTLINLVHRLKETMFKEATHED